MEIDGLFKKVLELESFSNQTLEDANQKAVEIKASAEKNIQALALRYKQDIEAMESQLQDALSKEQSKKAELYKQEFDKQAERIHQQFAISMPTIAEWFKKEIEQ
jgi:hypothetical protein